MEDPYSEPVEAKVVCTECKRLIEYYSQKQCPHCQAHPLRISSYQAVRPKRDNEVPLMYLLGS